MNFAVEMFFDPVADERVREVWERIAKAGLPSRLLDLGTTPHVSLGVCAELEPAAFAGELREFAMSESRVGARLVSVSTFANREGVVFFGLVPTRELLDLHSRFDAMFDRAGRTLWEYYRPGRWVPHCTLTIALDPAQVAAALGVCAEVALPIQASLVEIALVENPSARVHARFPLR